MERPASEYHVKPIAWLWAAAIVAASIGGAVFVTEWKPMTRGGAAARGTTAAPQGFRPATSANRYVLPLDRPNIPVPLNRDPANPDNALATGVAHLVAGDAVGALDPLNAAVRLSTGVQERQARWYLAVALERAGRTADAIQVLDALCSEQDRSAPSCIGLAALRNQPQ